MLCLFWLKKNIITHGKYQGIGYDIVFGSPVELKNP